MQVFPIDFACFSQHSLENFQKGYESPCFRNLAPETPRLELHTAEIPMAERLNKGAGGRKARSFPGGHRLGWPARQDLSALLWAASVRPCPWELLSILHSHTPSELRVLSALLDGALNRLCIIFFFASRPNLLCLMALGLLKQLPCPTPVVAAS